MKEFVLPFSVLAVPSIGQEVRKGEKQIRKVAPNRKEPSFFEYVKSTMRMAKFAALDLPAVFIAQMLPEKAAKYVTYRVFTSNGLLVMKLGQFLSTRPEVLSESGAESLLALQRAAPVPRAANVYEEFRKETGEHLPEGSVGPMIGAGCISQVVKLSVKGKEYAIKIVHSEAVQEMQTDLWVFRKFSSLLGFGRFIDEFGEMITKQLDLRNEKRNTEKFRENFRFYRSLEEDGSAFNWLLSKIRKYSFIFPNPVIATKNMLVTEYWPGTYTETAENKKHAKESLLFLFLHMVFKDKHIHADLHPGNIAHRSGKDKATVVYDSGLAHTISDRQRKNLLDLLQEMLLGNVERAVLLLIDRNPRNTHSEDQKRKVVGDVKRALGVRGSRAESKEAEKGPKSAQIDKRGPGSALIQVSAAIRRNNVFFDECYTNIVMSTMYVQNSALSGEYTYPWARIAAKSGLGKEYTRLLARRIAKKYVNYDFAANR